MARNRALAGYDNASTILADESREKPLPTHPDLSYGPHERQVIDLWIAESDRPTPLVVFFHGGGYKVGDKSIISFEMLDRLLPVGISVAAANYRLVQHARLPAAHYDGARVLQYLRYHAGEYNLDKIRFGAYGGSAGAKISLWLAFTPDMADPHSDDPVARESTTLFCVAPASVQTTMNHKLWEEWIPGYVDKTTDADLLARYDAETVEEACRIRDSLSLIDMVPRKSPPIYMKYLMSPEDGFPDNPARIGAWKSHHVNFGVRIKKVLDERDIESYLQYPGATTPWPRIPDFFIDKLLAGRE